MLFSAPARRSPSGPLAGHRRLPCSCCSWSCRRSSSGCSNGTSTSFRRGSSPTSPISGWPSSSSISASPWSSAPATSCFARPRGLARTGLRGLVLPARLSFLARLRPCAGHLHLRIFFGARHQDRTHAARDGKAACRHRPAQDRPDLRRASRPDRPVRALEEDHGYRQGGEAGHLRFDRRPRRRADQPHDRAWPSSFRRSRRPTATTP